MDRDEYELFERRPDGSSNWRGLVRGLASARASVWLLANELERECFAVDPATKQIVLARTPLQGARRIFQVAYGNALAGRARLLRRDGYDVTSALGNQRARFVLAMRPHHDLFVLGSAAAQPVRSEMACWLRQNYPNIRIVALNSGGHLINGLRYNAPDEPAAAWLPMIAAAALQSAYLTLS
ncbi:MAG TPA: hypothetical protein VMD56_13120 [Steroidobacteraceae bacterium]|nr:hypothetical protein [Steroidobacteraceae bacterium]